MGHASLQELSLYFHKRKRTPTPDVLEYEATMARERKAREDVREDFDPSLHNHKTRAVLRESVIYSCMSMCNVYTCTRQY